MIESVKEMKPMGLLIKASKTKDESFQYTIEDENEELVFGSTDLNCSANLTCFFGLCHALSILEDGEYEPHIHTNNMTALWWLKKKSVNSNIEDSELIEYINDSITYLENLEMEYEFYHYSWNKKK